MSVRSGLIRIPVQLVHQYTFTVMFQGTALGCWASSRKSYISRNIVHFEGAKTNATTKYIEDPCVSFCPSSLRVSHLTAMLFFSSLPTYAFASLNTCVKMSSVIPFLLVGFVLIVSFLIHLLMLLSYVCTDGLCFVRM